VTILIDCLLSCVTETLSAHPDFTVASEDPEKNKEILQARGNTQCDDSSES